MTITQLKNSLLILIFLFNYPSYADAEIIEINNLNKIQQDFQEDYSKNHVPQSILVVVVLDDLAFKPLLPLIADKTNRSVESKLLPVLQKMYSNPKSIYLDQLMLVSYKQELRYPSLPDFVKAINKAGTPIIAINKGFTGNFNKIPKFEIWIADYLKKNFDIDFANSFPKNNYIVFNNLANFANTYPVFYKGILTSNHIMQSNAALSFLIEVRFLPQVFIMISSDLDLLNSMKIQLTTYSNNITYIGYHLVNNKAKDEDIDLARYIKIANELVSKLNKIQRNNPTIKDKNKNPYDKTP